MNTVTYTIYQGFPILNGEHVIDPVGEEPYVFISSDPKSESVLAHKATQKAGSL